MPSTASVPTSTMPNDHVFRGVGATVTIEQGVVRIAHDKTPGLVTLIPIPSITDVVITPPGIGRGNIYFAYLGGPPRIAGGGGSTVLFALGQANDFSDLRLRVLERVNRQIEKPSRADEDPVFRPNPDIARLRAELAALGASTEHRQAGAPAHPADVMMNELLRGFRITPDSPSGAVRLLHHVFAPATRRRDVPDFTTQIAQRQTDLARLEEDERQAKARWETTRSARRNGVRHVVDGLRDAIARLDAPPDLERTADHLQRLRHRSLDPAPSDPPRIAVKPDEWLVAEYAVDLVGFRDVGFDLSARTEGNFGGALALLAFTESVSARPLVHSTEALPRRRKARLVDVKRTKCWTRVD